MKTKLYLFLIAVSQLLIISAKNGPDDITGIWLTNGDDPARIQIYKNGSKYSGKIIWLKAPNEENGKPKTDKNNPESKLRNRPLIGMEILHSFKYDKDNKWEDGKIYDPESGNTYKCEAWLEGNDKLKIRGYVGFSLLGRTEEWQRVSK